MGTMAFMKKPPRALVIKTLPPGIKGRSLSAARCDAIVKNVRSIVIVKSVARLSIEDTATGSGRVSFRGFKSDGRSS